MMGDKRRLIEQACKMAEYAYTCAYKDDDEEAMKVASAKLEGIERMLEVMEIPHENFFDQDHGCRVFRVSLD